MARVWLGRIRVGARFVFLMISSSNLRRRSGKGHFSGSRTDAVPTFFVS